MTVENRAVENRADENRAAEIDVTRGYSGDTRAYGCGQRPDNPSDPADPARPSDPAHRTSPPRSARWRALGTYVALVVADPARLPDLVRIAQDVLADVDRTCSRFRADSDLSRVNRGAGSWVQVDPLLVAALRAALAGAEQSDDLVSPLLGRTLIELGYDRTFSLVRSLPRAPVLTPVDPQAWRRIRVHDDRVWIPEGSSLDLGCTGKAFAADLIAGLAECEGIEAAVSVGGDVAVSAVAVNGGESAGFDVAISHHPDHPAETAVRLISGGLATSSTRVRRWVGGNAHVHHLIDPRTGASASETWHLVSAVGASAVAANIASTAAIILGAQAPHWLDERGVSARLVSADGSVTCTGSWPTAEAAQVEIEPAHPAQVRAS